MYCQIKKTKKGEVLATFSLLLIICDTCSAEPHDIACPNTSKTYNLSSPFGKNLEAVLADLSSKTPHNQGFYRTSFGNDSAPVVYGRALCRGDVTKEVCQNCLENITQEIIKECLYEGAIMWHEFCQVEYSYRPLTEEYAGKFPISNDAKNNVSEPEHFQSVLIFLMNKLSTKAASDASKLKFATGERKVSSTVTIYGLLQCTRDLSTGKCRNCLSSAAVDLYGCCAPKEGGTVFSKNCNIRFELNKFYRDTDAKGFTKMKLAVKVALVATLVIIVLVGLSAFYCYRFRKGEAETDDDVSQTVMLHTTAGSTEATTTVEANIVSHHGLPFMEFAIVKAATENFSDGNKLGHGSFGTVYKGVLPNGKDLAVKRLSRKSWQGIEEFKNEIKLIAKLQHRNLVRLLCCSIEEGEKLLIYEYMPNKSLDLFIFEASNRSQLGWDTRFGIINGIARGLLYLHEDSRLKIIHRDLKPSNVLLDHDMVAKISDFGMARIFYEEETTENTKRVIGTYGYMAPEYAMGGQFSVKSDVFSFGVILLEIISGKKNSGFYLTKHAPSLLEYAWRLWNEGTELELVDSLLTEASPLAIVVRCIHIALLCVQEDPAERPTMSSVVVLLADDKSLTLPQPGRPAFSVSRHQHDKSSSTDPFMTISSVSPR